MNPSRRDREWPKPRHTRHVWVRHEDVHKPPRQGYVLEWRRHSYKWSALVFYAIEEGDKCLFVQQWIPRDDLKPVRPEPPSFKPDMY